MKIQLTFMFFLIFLQYTFPYILFFLHGTMSTPV